MHPNSSPRCLFFLCRLLPLLTFSARAAEAVPLLPPEGVFRLALHQPDAAEPHAQSRRVPAVHPAFAEALQVTVARATPQVHQLQLQHAAIAPLEAGDLVRVRLTLRSASPGGEAVRIPFFVQDRGRQFRALFQRDLVAGSDWEEFTFTCPQTSNPFAGRQALRVEVAAVRRGQVQLRVPDVLVSNTHLLRIRIPVRSEDNPGATLSLRKREAPYTPYWSAPLTARPEWGVAEFMASVRHTDPQAVLMISLNTPGSLELSDLTLEYLTPDQALAHVSFDGNLLHSSSFPLGLSAPWASGANGTTAEHLRADPGVRGPSGLPALRLTPHRYEGRPMIQITAPFTGKPGVTHTFSFWARSEAPGMQIFLRMGPPQEALWRDPWQKIVSLTPEWQRVQFQVTLPPAPDLLYLARITSHDSGTFWVDQVMVEVGDTAGPFQRRGPVELHAVPAGEWGLHLDDEPIHLRLALTGDTRRAARIRGTLLDLYEEEEPLPDLTLSPDQDPLALQFRLPALNRFGSFLVTFQAETAAGEPLGLPAEVLVHRVRSPRHLHRAAPQSPFGIHVAAIPEAVRMAKRLGFNWNRMHYKFNWTSVQRPDGSWNFDAADRLIAPHREHHLLILTHFGGLPEHRSVLAPHWNGSAWHRFNAAPHRDHLDAFEEYARRLLAHAGDDLQAVEVWNEPFLAGFFVGDIQNGRPVREQPAVLVEMNRRARRAAEAAAYTGLLLWNVGPHYGESERNFDEAVRDLGGTAYLDALSLHRYTNARLGFPGDQFGSDLRIIREVFAGQPAAARIWNSEGGHGLSELFNLYRNVPPLRMRMRAEAQASQAVRYYLSNFAAGVEKVILYTMYPMDGWVPNYGYLNVDGTLSHIGPALSNLAWHLEDKHFRAQMPLGDAVYAQHYVGEAGQVLVLLPSGRGPATLTSLPPGVQAADVWGNPVSLPHRIGGGIVYLSAPVLDPAQAEAWLTP